MSTLDKLRNLNLPSDTVVSVRHISDQVDVNLGSWEKEEYAFGECDISTTFSQFISTPGLQATWGDQTMNDWLKEQKVLTEDITPENRQTVMENLAKELNSWNKAYDTEIFEYETEQHDYKWGEISFQFQVEVPLGNLLETSPDMRNVGTWELSVETESLGYITLS